MRISDWSSDVCSSDLVQRIVNASFHSAIGTSPARLLFGDVVTLDRGVLKPFAEGSGRVIVEDYVRQMVAAQVDLLQRSREFQERVVSERLKNSPPSPTSFEVGDFVLVAYPSRPPTKLSPRWRGPMAVVEVKG